MKNEVQKKAAEYTKMHRKKRRWRNLVICLAAMVMFGTTYVLALPAITMETATYCGFREHTHSEACDTRTLTCQQEESAGHMHDDSCYGTTTSLVCGQQEDDGHIHGEECYTRVLTCQQEESAGHMHDESCYETSTMLVCDQPEGGESGHVHDGECYETVTALICQQEEFPGHIHGDDCYEVVLSCGLEESGGHVHDGECYETVTALICQQEESPGHIHTDDCYTVTRTCGYETEHTHSLSCYSDPEADLETTADWERTLSGVKRTGVWADDLLAVAESQINYAESTKNYIVAEDGTTRGYTRYGAWYGRLYEDWSAMFVSFCLNYSNIPAGVVPWSDDCRAWLQMLSGRMPGYEAYGLYAAADAWTPRSGDLVFLDLQGDGAADHVGVVAEYTASLQDSDEIRIIAGDLNGHVAYASYRLGDGRILGYGCLPENPENSSAAETETETETETDTAAETETDTAAETESASETENTEELTTEAELETENVAELTTEAESETENTEELTTEAELETENVAELTTEAESETENTEELTTEAESETEDAAELTTEAESEAEGAAELTTEAEPETENTTEPVTEAESETEDAAELMTEAEPETENTTEPVTEAESETENTTEPMTESETAEDWKASLAGLTGEWTADLIAVAESQIGYTESSTDFIKTETEEVKGYTRYGAWYGEDYRYADWNALFVSFCLHYANIPQEAMPRSADAAEWVRMLSGEAEGDEGFALYAPAEERTPFAGNLVFFDQDGDGEADRVGIVVETAADESESTVLRTIQGDVDDAVQYVSCRADDAGILGYAVLPETVEDIMAFSAEETLETEPVEEFYIWMWVKAAGGTYIKIADYSEWKWTTDGLIGAHTKVADVLKIKDKNEYLIPVSYYTTVYGSYGYEFNEADTESCPFRYAFNPEKTEEPLEASDYVQVDDKWYVRITSIGGYTPPRSNIYYEYSTTEVNAFELWMYKKESSGSIEPVASCLQSENSARTDVLQITDSEFYLIPVNCLASNYSIYGYTFNSGADCPFQYGADGSGSVLTDAGYMQVSGNWYVRVRAVTDSEIPGSHIYFVFGAEKMETFRLWLHVKTGGSADYTMAGAYAESSNNALTDVLRETGTNYYLIPVTYFNASYGSYGYKFSEASAEYCPFRYAPDANNGSSNLTAASYIKLDGSWYVRVADTGTYTNDPQIPRSNVYYVKTVSDAVSPAGTVINLFDYWTTVRWPDGGDFNEGNQTSGINTFSPLQFRKDTDSGSDINKYSQSPAAVEGIVDKVLKDGYPALSQTHDSSGTSLAYLFDPEYNHGYRTVNSGVTGLLQVDSDGYYYYDSSKNFAELDTKTNQITLYESNAVKASGKSPNGQFFPYNRFVDVADLQSRADNINHYFGMTLMARFNQAYGGYTTAQKSTQMVFDFAGDDDVWIFIDDVLVADLGGIHDRASLDINFATGVVSINKGTNYEKTTTLYEAYEAAGMTDATEWTDYIDADGAKYPIFRDDTFHVLRFFYLERGNWDSNLYLKYNLQEIPKSSIVKVDQYGEPVANAQFALYAADKQTIQTENAAEPEEEAVIGTGEESGAGAAAGSIAATMTVAGMETDNSLDHVYKYRLDPKEGEIEPVYISLDGLTYDMAYEDVIEDGIITKKAGTITITADDYDGRTITPIYYGVTDAKGNMTFVTDDGFTLSLAELKQMAASDYFILREIKVPEGYRLVSDEVWLYLKNNVLYCDNIYTSGAYAAATVTITATQYLCLDKTFAWVETNDENTMTTFHPESLEEYAKRESGVVGTTEGGDVSVHYYDPVAGGDSVKGHLFAVVLKYSGNSGEATALEDLSNWTPVYGNDITGYYYENVTGTGDGSSVMREDFVRTVIDVARKMEDNDSYSDSLFAMTGTGAMQLTISQVPGSIKNYYEMLMRAYNPEKDGELADYLKENLEYSIAYYWTMADDMSGATAQNTFRVNATMTSNTAFDSAFGAAIEVPNLVNRLFVQKMDASDNLLNGAVFAMYRVGQDEGNPSFYYIASDGKQIYLEPDADGDNAGTAVVENDRSYTYVVDGDSGVISVGRQDSSGNLEASFTIIPVDVQKTNDSSIAGEAGTAVFGSSTDSLTEGCYIVREISAPDGYTLNTAEVQVLVDDYAVYANAGTANDGVTVARGPGYVVYTMHKFASEGQIDNTLTWVYEQMQVSGETTSFADVYDIANWEYVHSYTGPVLSATTVTIAEQAKALTTYLIYDPDSENSLFNYTVFSDRKVYDRSNTYSNVDSTKRRLRTSVGWSYYRLYQDYEYGIVASAENGANYTDLRKYGDISSLLSRSTYIQVADTINTLTITKVDSETLQAANPSVLKGAAFTLGREIAGSGGTQTVYCQINEDGTVSWNTADDGEAPTITAEENGVISLTQLPNGVYTLTEVSAPDGYYLMADSIIFTVKNGLIYVEEDASDSDADPDGNAPGDASGTDGGNADSGAVDGAAAWVVENNGKNVVALRIGNRKGYVLPSTGGIGIFWYTTSGLILMGSALLYLLYKQRRKEDAGI